MNIYNIYIKVYEATLENRSNRQDSEEVDEKILTEFDEKLTKLINYVDWLYLNLRSGREDEVIARLSKLKEQVEQFIRERDVKNLKEYTISRLQNEPLSLIILLIIFNMYNTRKKNKIIERYIEEILTEQENTWEKNRYNNFNERNEGKDDDVLIFTYEELVQYLKKYAGKYIYKDFRENLTAKEKVILKVLAFKLGLISMTDYLRALVTEDKQAKLIAWIALSDFISQSSFVDKYRNDIKKLFPHLFELIQETGNGNLVSILEKMMDRNEENIHMFINALLKLNKVPQRYLEFIASLLCTDELNTRLEVYVGVQELYNKGLIDDKDLDLIYDKLIKECNKEQLHPT